MLVVQRLNENEFEKDKYIPPNLPVMAANVVTGENKAYGFNPFNPPGFTLHPTGDVCPWNLNYAVDVLTAFFKVAIPNHSKSKLYVPDFNSLIEVWNDACSDDGEKDTDTDVENCASQQPPKGKKRKTDKIAPMPKKTKKTTEPKPSKLTPPHTTQSDKTTFVVPSDYVTASDLEDRLSGLERNLQRTLGTLVERTRARNRREIWNNLLYKRLTARWMA
jgi:hypothetical protein